MNKAILLFRQIRYDFKAGCINQWKLYLYIFIASYVSIHQFKGMDLLSGNKMMFMDGIFYSFRGLPPYNIWSMEQFRVSIEWFFFMTGAMFIVGNFGTRDLSGFGVQTMIKNKSPFIWWFSKIIWCVISTVLYMLVVVGSFAICLKSKLIINIDYSREFFYLEENFSKKEIVLYCIVAPFVTILTIVIMQFVISILSNSEIAFVVCASYLILSAYITNKFFIGNYSMMFRYKMITSEAKFDYSDCFMVCGIMMALFVVVGYIVFSKKEIYKYGSK